jgi:AraC-like DNA-binding protein
VAACLIAVMNFVLVVKSMRMLRQHISALKSNFSYTEGSTLGWIWWWLTFTVIKVVFLLLVISVDSMAVTLTGILSFTIEPVISSTLILRQKNLYAKPAPANEKQLPNKIPAMTDTGVAKMTSNKRRDLKKNLMNLLHKEEIFKDPELNIEKIREMLGTNRTYLSQVINQDMSTTFYQLINTYRLQKAASIDAQPAAKRYPPQKHCRNMRFQKHERLLYALQTVLWENADGVEGGIGRITE